MKKSPESSKKSIPASNLKRLRTLKGLSQEQVAEKLNVSRQAVAKWESGESLPDIINTRALAELYGITVDSLFDAVMSNEPKSCTPKGKYIFGAVKVGENGTVQLPEKALKVFKLKKGSVLLVLGDDTQGIALCKPTFVIDAMRSLKESGLAEDDLDDIMDEDI